MRDLVDHTWGKDLDADAIGPDAESFLRALGGPAWIEVPGRDRDRVRVVSTLLHANEPSGIRALHRWLRSGARPAVDLQLLVVAVETALEPPGFARRFRSGGVDLNRIWCPGGESEGAEGAALVAEVLARLRARPPECLIDLHNNTGQNPPYGVTFRLGVPERNLIAGYARRVIHTPLELGTIVEATCNDFPSVTVECGRAGDPRADEVAFVGTRRLAESDDLALDRTPELLDVVVDPVRVCVREGSSLEFGDGPEDGRGAALVVSREIDRHNFELVPAGTTIGWLASGSDWPIEALGAGGEDRSFELFAAVDGRIETRREMIPVMMTTHRENALADCLFYAAWPERRLG